MKKKVVVLSMFLTVLLSACSGTKKEDYERLQSANEELKSNNEEINESLTTAKSTISDLEKQYDELIAEKASLSEEYDKLEKKYHSYKKKMKPYEELDAAEAEARKIEAERKAAEKKAAEEAAAAEAAAAAAAEEAAGYETGISYEQLARTPDEFEGKKVKFYGKVIQVLEGTGTINIRLAVNDDYDMIILAEYDSGIVASRILEDDYITIYGVSTGTISYEATSGTTITIPGMSVDRIEQ